MAVTSAPPPLTNENTTRIVWALAWPAVALNSLQVVNSLLDGSFVGHLDSASLVAYGGMMPVLFLMFSFAMSIAAAATALVSRAYGANNTPEYHRATRQALSLSIFGGFSLAGVCWLIAPIVASRLLPHGQAEASALMAHFIRIYALGLPAIFVIQALAGSLRGVGDTKSPMVISGIQIGAHMLLNFLLIFPPRTFWGATLPGANLGLAGAATALTTSAWISAGIYIIFAARTKIGTQWRVELPAWSWVKRIVRIAAPAAVMSVMRVGSLTLFQLILNNVADGPVAIPAMRTGFAIESIMFMPSFGLSMAAAALVGQSLGMRRPERAEALGWKAAHHAAFVTLALCVPIFLGAEFLAGTMLGDKVQVIHEAGILIRFLCTTEILFAYAMVLTGAMQGAGDTQQPMILTFVSLILLRVPVAYWTSLSATQTVLFPGLGLGASGAWFAMALSSGVMGVLSIFLFRQGKWKTTKV